MNHSTAATYLFTQTFSYLLRDDALASNFDNMSLACMTIAIIISDVFFKHIEVGMFCLLILVKHTEMIQHGK